MKRTGKMLKGKRWLLTAMTSLMVFAVFATALGQEAGSAPAVTPAGVDTASGEAQPNPEEQNVASNMYMAYTLPDVTEGAYAYEQEQVDTVVYEKYYLMLNGEKRLMYSINFGQEEEGTWLGLLEDDAGGTAITYTIYPFADDELAALTETQRQGYFELMDGLGTVLTSITEDSRFREDKPLPVGENQLVSLAYWALELPGNMTWTETNKDGEYQVVFSGWVQGEQVPLYTVRIGEIEAQSVLGTYRIGGEEKTLSVESFDLPRREDWTEDDYSTAYRMMETINDVIGVIDASQQFTPQ